MRLLRTCCACQSRRGRGGHSDRESVSGSETGAAVASAEAVDHPRSSRRNGGSGGGSKRRQRATYRYEVVYRREEFSHDYLDHPVQNRHPFRPPEGEPPPDSQPPPVVPFQSADYSLLSNYGRLEDFHPPALHSAVHCWEQQQQQYRLQPQLQQQQHSRYSDQPLYQNFGAYISSPLPFSFKFYLGQGRLDWTLTPFPRRVQLDVCWQVAAPIWAISE